MLVFGKVNNVDHATGKVRVLLPAEGITTGWLPLATPGTRGAVYFAPLQINSTVACLMDENAEDGVVLGAIFSEVDRAGGTATEHKIELPGGARVSFDTLTRQFEVTNGAESLGGLLGELLTAISIITHPSAGSPPANAATFLSLKVRLATLLK